MKRLGNSFFIVLGVCLIAGTCYAGEETRTVKPFSKLMVSPLIDVVLVKGETESVQITAENIDLEKINTQHSGKTLKIFLDNARMGTNNEKLIDPDNPEVLISRSRYHGVKVKVLVTYRALERVEVRGDGSLICEDRLGSDKVKLKLMGDIDATINSIDAKKFVISSMGSNEIFIGGGAADKQVYRIYGESVVNTTRLQSTFAKVSVYGEGEVSISTDTALKLKTLGESRIYYQGQPTVRKSLVLGDATIRAL